MAEPRLALAGCGTVGAVHATRLVAEGAQIVAVCDPDAEALSRMARALPQRPLLFRSEQDLLASREVDAIVLCTPHARHADQIAAALEAGVHVLCEKPFVTHYETGVGLVKQAREKNLALFVSYTRRARGHARFLQAAAGRIGPVQFVSILRSQPWLQTHGRTWRMQETEGGGFLRDAGASMLDLCLHLIPLPVSEASVELYRAGTAEVDVCASVRLRFRGEARVELTLLGDAVETLERIQIFGERGTAGWCQREGVPADLYLKELGGALESPDPATYRIPTPDIAFLTALRSGRRFDAETASDLYDAATALPTIALVERLYREASWR
ncbi:Gfo/Idh/MocA family protein [Armatimonas sp.]|uniref:Gfo/Idh/MocA family protein n=1 Tax=Armatimonas sp. TaxID=1872638 RepID=UPI00374FF3EF